MATVYTAPGTSVTADSDAARDDGVEHLIDAYRRPAFNLAYRLVRRPEDAADAVQDAFVLAMRATRGSTAAPREPGRFRSWLLKIVANVALAQLRRRKSSSSVSLDALTADLSDGQPDQPLTTVVRREQRGDVLQALLALPDAQRAALTLREYQGLSYHEIGQLLGLERGAITALLYRARAGFRAAYEGVAAHPKSVGCSKLAPLISAMLDEELEADTWQRVDRHLAGCLRCRRELRQLRRGQRLHSVIPILAPPAGWSAATTLGAAGASGAAGLVGVAGKAPALGGLVERAAELTRPLVTGSLLGAAAVLPGGPVGGLGPSVERGLAKLAGLATAAGLLVAVAAGSPAHHLNAEPSSPSAPAAADVASIVQDEPAVHPARAAAGSGVSVGVPPPDPVRPLFAPGPALPVAMPSIAAQPAPPPSTERTVAVASASDEVAAEAVFAAPVDGSSASSSPVDGSASSSPPNAVAHTTGPGATGPAATGPAPAVPSSNAPPANERPPGPSASAPPGASSSAGSGGSGGSGEPPTGEGPGPGSPSGPGPGLGLGPIDIPLSGPSLLDLPPVDVPPLDLPPIDLPPVELPVLATGPLDLPPVDLPAIDLPAVNLPPVDLLLAELPLVDGTLDHARGVVGQALTAAELGTKPELDTKALANLESQVERVLPANLVVPDVERTPASNTTDRRAGVGVNVSAGGQAEPSVTVAAATVDSRSVGAGLNVAASSATGNGQAGSGQTGVSVAIGAGESNGGPGQHQAVTVHTGVDGGGTAVSASAATSLVESSVSLDPAATGPSASVSADVGAGSTALSVDIGANSSAGNNGNSSLDANVNAGIDIGSSNAGNSNGGSNESSVSVSASVDVGSSNSGNSDHGSNSVSVSASVDTGSNSSSNNDSNSGGSNSLSVSVSIDTGSNSSNSSDNNSGNNNPSISVSVGSISVSVP